MAYHLWGDIMFLVLRKRTILFAATAVTSAIAVSLLGWHFSVPKAAVPTFLPQASPTVIVIDPGHGGEDGGAVSESGVMESNINLAVSLQLQDLFRLCGIPTRMTRTEDISIGDHSLSTIRARKASDIRARVAMVDETEGALLISIHQNSLPSSLETHGAQVFWNQQIGAYMLAKTMQKVLNGSINTHRAKEAKKIDSSIYLMNHTQSPAVLVECGFLSNREEAELLQTKRHQIRLAVSIAAGYLRHVSGGEESA